MYDWPKHDSSLAKLFKLMVQCFAQYIITTLILPQDKYSDIDINLTVRFSFLVGCGIMNMRVTSFLYAHSVHPDVAVTPSEEDVGDKYEP